MFNTVKSSSPVAFPITFSWNVTSTLARSTSLSLELLHLWTLIAPPKRRQIVTPTTTITNRKTILKTPKMLVLIANQINLMPVSISCLYLMPSRILLKTSMYFWHWRIATKLTSVGTGSGPPFFQKWSSPLSSSEYPLDSRSFRISLSWIILRGSGASRFSSSPRTWRTATYFQLVASRTSLSRRNPKGTSL